MASELPENLFLNPVWHALRGPHASLALSAGEACRYPADVAPFAAVSGPGMAAMKDLHSLLLPKESLWIVDRPHPQAPGLALEDSLECVQMVLPRAAPPPPATAQVEPLAAPHAEEMVALTNLAFPGFFRTHTHRMGSYCGLRAGRALVAMGGERLRLDRYPELSAICTHPAHRGKGHARNIIGHLVGRQRREGLVSWLHVGAPNRHASELYRNLGFEPVRSIMMHRVMRIE